MAKKILLSIMVMTGLWFGQASEGWCEEINPSVALNIYGSQEWVQDSREPLLIYVGISNPEAFRITQENQQAQILQNEWKNGEKYAGLSTEQKKKFDEFYQTKKVPVLILGSKNKPFLEILGIVFENERGEKLSLDIKRLMPKSLDASISLDPNRPMVLYFGVSPEALALLSEGKYTLYAVLKDEFHIVSSPKAQFILKKDLGNMKNEEVNRRNYLYARYSLLDEDYDKALAYSEKMLKQDPKSLMALELKADAFDGQGKRTEARAIYELLLNNYLKKYPSFEYQGEPPAYYIRRLRELRESSD